MIDENYPQKLKDQIWATRISRVNAEHRLKSKESFIQAMNIYYSCFTVFLSICLLVRQDFAYSLLTLAMTIVLMISILYFKGLKYTERALDYRKNYTELQKLEFELSHKINEDKISDIEQGYCNLLAEGENHITFDYQKTVAKSNEAHKKTHWDTSMALQYYWGVIWRFLLKSLCLVLPILLSFLIYWGKAHGWINS